MSIREIRLRQEALGNTLRKMRADFDSENIITQYNGRKIQPLALEYHIRNNDDTISVVTVENDGFSVMINNSIIIHCNYMRNAEDEYLSLIKDNEIIATMKVKTR